ncbi:MAG: hypothetical protein ACK5ZK_02580 [Armatimonadota bacterium]|jgi:YD repeat-containing protein|nr:hypothetical protein [Fimbriimonadaceae bacterium]MCZ8139510.1 hypothetical protein [Fimbriimonadaceae bacterium]
MKRPLGSYAYSYDAVGRATTLVESVSGANAVTIVDTYDAAGRKTKQVRNTTTTTYTYDNADRLTGQQVTGARATFVMDAVGNITVKSQEGTSPQTITRSSVARPLTRSGNIHSAWPCPRSSTPPPCSVPRPR